MLRLWTDFNDIYDHRYTRTSLRFADFSPGEEPAVGRWAELWDYEGNRCYGIITQIKGKIIHVRLDWSSWVSSARFPEIRFSGLVPEQPRPSYWFSKESITGPDRDADDLFVEGPELLEAS